MIIVNQDGGQLGQALVDLFQSADLADLVAPALVSDPAAARAQIDAGDAVAAIIIPAGFTDSIIPADNQAPSGEVVQIEIYKNPLSPVSAGVIQSIVEEFISRVETGRVGGQVVVTQMLAAGLITPDQVNAIALEMGQRQANAVDQVPAIALQSAQSGQPQKAFNPMAYMAPGMALMFLMYTVSNGGRSMLAEQTHGTLPRLLVSPTNSAQVLVGKIFGVYLTGVMQMLILIVGLFSPVRHPVGRPAGGAGAGPGGGLCCHRLGHADHLPGAHSRPGQQRLARPSCSPSASWAALSSSSASCRAGSR